MISKSTVQEKYRKYREQVYGNEEGWLPCELCGKVLTETDSPLCSVCERRELEALLEDELFEIFYQVVPLYHPRKWLCVQFRRDGFSINVLIEDEEAVKDFPGLYLDSKREEEIKEIINGVMLTSYQEETSQPSQPSQPSLTSSGGL